MANPSNSIEYLSRSNTNQMPKFLCKSMGKGDNDISIPECLKRFIHCILRSLPSFNFILILEVCLFVCFLCRPSHCYCDSALLEIEERLWKIALYIKVWISVLQNACFSLKWQRCMSRGTFRTLGIPYVLDFNTPHVERPSLLQKSRQLDDSKE